MGNVAISGRDENGGLDMELIEVRTKRAHEAFTQLKTAESFADTVRAAHAFVEATDDLEMAKHAARAKMLRSMLEI